ncbi:MAG: enoyl-CoA hydratase/isomerase family protein [Comamonas sp.]|jgi:isohexenylglutaconyl-CoA hydratase|uniref:enoyl-CoA hydratase/isomerase family protein n=1 Tax=Comamonas sp. TaxID=34028 RepID=UPI002823ADB4|nr:enoyl-CoA hydratase/isomerase family protein [Comamonas sp.]MDR0214600.1 enoyl-CoA hydratase/isomerase family protein [Comamonas sp.]
MAEVLDIDRQPLGSGFMEWWRLNSPQTRNALTDEMVQALGSHCERAREDAQLRLIVLTGSGGHFCAGGSLGGFSSSIGRPLLPGESDPLVQLNREFGSLLQRLSSLPQLLVAAVQGAAMGGGVGLVCVADLVIADASAVFATPEVTLGIVPAQIAPFVQRRLGDALARQWLLCGQRWSAQQALQAGLVQTLIHADDALPWQSQLQTRIASLAQAAPAAVAATKRLLETVATQSLDASLDQGALAFAAALRGTEAGAGIKAFANKQPVPWAVSGDAGGRP